jgi:hypothetical protein
MIESGRTRLADVGRLAPGVVKNPGIRAKASKIRRDCRANGSVSLKTVQPEIEEEAIWDVGSARRL